MRPIKCLLIDDDFEEAEIFHYAIKELVTPVRLFTCATGFEAVLKLSHGEIKPDIIFLDYCMPKMDGRDCLVHLKAMKSIRKASVIVYSSFTHNNLKSDMEKLGADGFLQKESDFNELVEKLGNCFSSIGRSRNFAFERKGEKISNSGGSSIPL